MRVKLAILAIAACTGFTSCLAQSAGADSPPAHARQPNCRGEGQDIDGKDLGPKCCSGLTPVAMEQPEGALCRRVAPPSVLVCTRCGDGLCGVGENGCNCPVDCKHSPSR